MPLKFMISFRRGLKIYKGKNFLVLETGEVFDEISTISLLDCCIYTCWFIFSSICAIKIFYIKMIKMYHSQKKQETLS